MSKNTPSPTGDNGRVPNGRFAAGNQFGRGNPLAKQAQMLRTAMYAAIRPIDLRMVVKKMIELAKAGDVAAARVVLDRALGPPLPIDYEERLAELEKRLSQQMEE